MMPVSKRALDWIYSIILLIIVLLSWGFVIYAARITGIQQLQKKFPNSFAKLQIH
ncbi:small integral membrane protein 27-like [Heterodontus francisci]|uniref:small integral membrane protein 27-like n=1 Tax=Heterodontus francisci TaxID=7792 RepID=UPI00355B38A4